MAQPLQSDLIYWEDIPIGQPATFGRRLVSKEDIVDFARAFDPQPFHLDEEAAKKSVVGRLCASGWHSCAMFMRLLAEDLLNKAAGLGSPGVEEVRWLQPIFPGDVISARYTCVSKRVLKSRPNVGICQMTFEVLNQSGAVVMTMSAAQLLRLRAPKAAP